MQKPVTPFYTNYTKKILLCRPEAFYFRIALFVSVEI